MAVVVDAQKDGLDGALLEHAAEFFDAGVEQFLVADHQDQVPLVRCLDEM